MDSYIPPPLILGLDVPSWRPGQEEVLESAFRAIKAGKIPLIDAPPGFGKRIIAKALATLLDDSTLILTGTKTLQKSYLESPTGLPIVTGRRNHRCLLVKEVNADEAPCRYDFECAFRHGDCQYFRQRDQGIEARIVVTNYAMALSDPEASLLSGRQLLICDEAHLLERQLAMSSSIRLRLSQLQFKPLIVNPFYNHMV